MRLQNYTLSVSGGTELDRDGATYVNMRHGQVYSIFLSNMSPVPCDATVRVDGQDIGTWRIGGESSIVLDRPASNDGKFTFYRIGTSEAGLAQIEDNDFAGLVQAEFVPEKRYANPITVSMPLVFRSGSQKSAGGTGLSGHSAQQFGRAAAIELDFTKRTILSVRLLEVSRTGEVRPLNASPIPPRIG